MKKFFAMLGVVAMLVAIGGCTQSDDTAATPADGEEVVVTETVEGEAMPADTPAETTPAETAPADAAE